MAYDSQRGRTVLFGGQVPGTPWGGGPGETWEWDGNNWSLVSSTGPLYRYEHAMAYDSSHALMVMFGGDYVNYNRYYLNDTWAWNGRTSTWTFAGSTVSPARSNHAMVFDSQRQLTVVYGGHHYDGSNYVALDDTWELGPPLIPAMFPTLGVGCPGSGGVPSLAALPGDLPRLGEALDMRIASLPTIVSVVAGVVGFSTTSNNSPLGSYPLPADLSPVGMAGCTQYVSADFYVFMVALGGHMNWSISIPASSGLVSTQFYVQGVVFDPPANPFGATVTNAATASIGY
jgi:hypothetical protein